MKRQERRSQHRNMVSLGLILEKTVTEYGGPLVIRYGGRATDLNSRGLGLTMDCTARTGDVVKLYVPTKDLNTDLPVYAEVVWTVAEEGHFRAGLRFLG